MRSAASFVLLSAFAASAVVAQSSPGLDGIFHHTVPDVIECGPDVIVDNFTQPLRRIQPLQGETAERQVNLLGGDYGSDGKGLTFNVSGPPANYIDIVANDPSTAFFFFKLDVGACYDITSYNSLVMDIVAPVGGKFDIGLTQKLADCSARAGGESGKTDTKYVHLADYMNPGDGKTRQTVIIPFYDLAGPNQLGTPFDFVHVKDITFINWGPAAGDWKIYDIRVRRVCGNNGPTGTNKTISAGSHAALNGSHTPGATHTTSDAASATGTPDSTGGSGSGSAAGQGSATAGASTLKALGTASMALIGAVLYML